MNSSRLESIIAELEKMMYLMMMMMKMMMMMMTTVYGTQYSLGQACGCQCVGVTRPEDGGGNCKAAYRGRLWCYTQDISGSVYCRDSTKSSK